MSDEKVYRKTKVIGFRVTPGHRVLIERVASSYGKSVSRFARDVVQSEVERIVSEAKER